jgi:hypothetical protein
VKKVTLRAMWLPFYAVATRPIIDDMRENRNTIMVRCPDDSSSCGKFSDLLECWKRLGPSYGYHPNAKKAVLIVKNREDFEEAERLFGPLGVEVIINGQRHK